MVKELHSLLNRYRASGRSVPVEQDADQPTTAVESKSEGDEKPEPESGDSELKTSLTTPGQTKPFSAYFAYISRL